MKLVIGNIYKWKHDSNRLIYIGKQGSWNQFSLENANEIYCEVLDSDLHLMEECWSE